MKKAIEILEAGAQHMRDRASVYDNEAGEHSVPATVTAFNAVTGHELTAEQGWLFMALLKAVRTQQGDFKQDNYEDGAAYFALAGEQGADDRNAEELPILAETTDNCVECGVQIPSERQIALPGVQTCVECAERIERGLL